MKRPSSRLGEIIRRQRELNRLTLRQFAAMTGISNPYLSQIERGLRTPSREVVGAIARSLETSLEDLYDQAGLGDPDHSLPDPRARLQGVLNEDPGLTPRTRRVLVEVYDGLVASSAPSRQHRRARGGNGA